MRRTGLPAHDLRILDPLLSYPSTVLGRERAIVINLEHIKAIITAHEVLLLNSRDPSVTPFVEELHSRILRHHQAQGAAVAAAASDDSKLSKVYDTEEGQSREGQDEDEDPDPVGEEVKSQSKQNDIQNGDGMKILPFEFVALEACLEAACSVLENEAKTLEQEAHPALDKLTSKISTLNLERVHQIKSRLVAITGRVQKLHSSSASSINDDDVDNDHHNQLDVDDSCIPPEISLEEGGAAASDDYNQHDDDRLLVGVSRDSRASTTYSTTTKHLDVEELEMLLEAYFVQIDGTLNKLSTLREYVDDTEDYINIMLDDKQNHLLQMGVMLTTSTLVVSAFVVVAGIFGMNIHIELFDSNVAGNREFFWTVGGNTAGTIFLYVVAISWCKYKRLLE
ncbi:hypothetical protein AAHE18_15G110200 [Arachis hypogaea]